MPASCAAWNRMFDVRTTEAESLARTNEPCRSPNFFTRYLESPLFDRYVCGELERVLQSTEFGTIGKAFGAHASAELVTSAATSGMPVALPAESLQLTSSSTVCSSNAPVPTSARSSPQALMIALRAS